MKVSPLVLLAAAAMVLGGCATAEPPRGDQDAATQSAAPTPTPTPVVSEEDALAEAMSGQMGATVLDVLAPQTFLIEPSADEQETNGLSGEATVSIREDSGLVTPAEGECGYNEAIAFTKQHFVDNPETAYVIEGNFFAEEFYDELFLAGYGYIPNNESEYEISQAEGVTANAGLYALCPDFGE